MNNSQLESPKHVAPYGRLFPVQGSARVRVSVRVWVRIRIELELRSGFLVTSVNVTVRGKVRLHICPVTSILWIDRNDQG